MNQSLPPVPDDRRFLTTAERVDRVHKLLSHYGWSLYHWAKLMGVRQHQASRYLESDDPRLTTLIRMATSLGCTISFLTDRDFIRGADHETDSQDAGG